MKKLVIFIFTISLFHQFTFGQWVLQNSGVATNLYSIQFVNSNTGWAIGANSIILKTTNAGLNWFQQQSNLSSGRDLNGIDMLDTDVGFIAGWFSAILKTTNGGSNWIVLREMPIGQGNSYNDVDFINDQTGWICGFQGLIWKTTNGGMNWDSSFIGSNAPLRDISFVNSQTGWVVGDVGYMRKTTNGGVNWTFQFFGTTFDYWYNSLKFINENTGWVVSYNDKVFRTTNAGTKWDTVSNTPGLCIFFINALTGWTGGDNGDMFKSTNGGLNFYPQTKPIVGGFHTDIYFQNDSVGWSTIVNHIMHTTNAGGEFVGLNQLSTEIPKQYKLNQNYPNPFNSQTKITFEMTKKDFINIEVFDVLGRTVETLLNKELAPGIYELEWNANNYSSGVYFYKLVSQNYTETRKMILNK